jgi:3-deoxy-D-manno-octulosonic acid kinase
MHLFDIFASYFRFTRLVHKAEPSTPSRSVFATALFPPQTSRQVLAAWDRLLKIPALRDKVKTIAKRQLLGDIRIPAQGKIFLPKIYVSRDPGRLIQSGVFFGEAERNGATLSYLAGKGIHVTRPLCLIRESARIGVHRTVLFLESLPETAIDYKSYLPLILPEKSLEFRTDFFTRAGRAVGQVHATGVYTEDTDQNLMVEEQGNTWIFHFLDFDNFYPWRVPTRRRSIHAIAHALDTGKGSQYTCNAQEAEAFVDAYLATRNKPKWHEPIMNHLRKYRPQIFSNPTCRDNGFR